MTITTNTSDIVNNLRKIRRFIRLDIFGGTKEVKKGNPDSFLPQRNRYGNPPYWIVAHGGRVIVLPAFSGTRLTLRNGNPGKICVHDQSKSQYTLLTTQTR